MKLIQGWKGTGQVRGALPSLRVIAGRPASNVPMPFREPEKPADAVNFCDVAAIIGAGLIVLGLLFLVWVFAPMARLS